MAVDNSSPRILPIAMTALLSVVILIALKFAFDWYFVAMFEEEEFRKVGSVAPTELLALHAAETTSFAAAPVPLDKAMAIVARGRSEAIPGLPAGITPEASDDTSSLYGWAQALQSPKLPPDPPAPPTPAPAPVPANHPAPHPPGHHP